MIYLFKYLLNNFKNYIYINAAKIKINTWFFVQIIAFYTYQRNSLNLWLGITEGLESKIIKTIKYKFNFLALYKNSTIVTIVLLFFFFFL